MARITVPNLKEYEHQLYLLGAKSEKVCKYAIYDAAGMVLEAIKAATPVGNGDLQESISLAPMRNDNGFVNTKIEWTGYDRDGTPNALKAAVLEHGRSNKSKVPFIRPAVQSVKRAAQFSMQMKLDEIIEKIINKE